MAGPCAEYLIKAPFKLRPFLLAGLFLVSFQFGIEIPYPAPYLYQSLALGIIEPLKEAVFCFLEGECPVETVRQFAKDVGTKESEVDTIEWDLTKAIFVSSLDHSQKMHLKLCLDHIVEVSDRAEDAADQLELVTLKAMF